MKTTIVSRFKTIFYTLFSLLIAYRLSSIPSRFLSDRANYTFRYNTTNERIDAFNSIFVIFLEPLYTLLNKAFLFLNNPNLTLQIFAFFICFSFCFFALKGLKHWYLSLLFFLLLFFERPTFLLFLNALRQGIALALFFLFFIFKKKISYKNTIVFICLLGLFHLTFFILAGLLVLDWWVIKSPRKFKNFKRVALTVLVSVILSSFALIITKYVGAKQAEDIAQVEATVSGLGFINVLLVFLYIWITKPKEYDDTKISVFYSLHFTISLFYLGSYFILPTFARILSLGIPFSYFIILHKAKLMDLIIVALILVKALYIFFFTNKIGIYVYVPLNTFFKHIFGIEIIN